MYTAVAMATTYSLPVHDQEPPSDKTTPAVNFKFSKRYYGQCSVAQWLGLAASPSAEAHVVHGNWLILGFRRA